MSELSEKHDSTCKEFTKCLEYLYLMLDNEATEKQEAYLKNHLENCLYCFEQYEVERHIRDLIRSKVLNLPVPGDLAQEIKTKVFQSV